MSDINDFVPLWGIWQIDSLIGEGSFGKVYKAVREEFGNKYYCAIKHISVPESENEVKQYLKENASTDITTAKVYYHQLVSDITNEINTMYSLSGNTNIVTYQEHKITEKPDGVGFDILIKMELLTELSDKVREQSLTQQEIVKLGVDICTALEVCAAKKLIHRDIKPQNIFISEEGNYKLGDFGISRQLEKTVNGLSKKGTYAYMAPEVFKGEDYGASVDVYSLGLVMYRLLNGNRLPFLPLAPAPVRYDDNEKALSLRLKGETIPKPAFADDALSAVVLKMCAHDRKARYNTAKEAKAALLALEGTNRVVPMVAPVGARSLTDEPMAAPGFYGTAPIQSTGPNQAAPLPYYENTVGVFNQTVTPYGGDRTVNVFSGAPDITNDVADTESEECEKEKKKRKIPWIIMAAIWIVLAVAGGTIAVLALKNKGADDPNLVASTGDPLLSNTDATSSDGMLKVEDVVGKTQAEAESILKGQGFEVLVKVGYSDTAKEGIVISQRPEAGNKSLKGSVVAITVSLGKAPEGTYAIIYDACGGEVSPSAEQLQVPEGKTLSSLPVATRQGYTFDGWYTAETGGTKVTEVSAAITLYAHWTADQSSSPGSSPGSSSPSTGQSQFTVSYSANGGGGAPASTTVAAGTNITVPNGPSSAPSYTITYNANGGSVSPGSKTVYKVFAGWNTSPNGNGAAYSVGSSLSVNENVTLYAIWWNQAIGSLPVPTRDTFNFSGWYVDSVRVDANYVASGNTTLVAQWSLNDVSGWVLASAVPAGAEIVSYKWVYTERTTTTSSSPTMSGWTKYDETYTWGSWSGWSQTKPSANATREIEQRIWGYTLYACITQDPNSPYGRRVRSYTPATSYYPYRESYGWHEPKVTKSKSDVDSAPQVKPGASGGTGNSFRNDDTKTAYVFSDGVNMVPMFITSTIYEYRYRDRVYTYHFEKFENKETAPTTSRTAAPSGTGISNQQEYVQYRLK